MSVLRTVDPQIDPGWGRLMATARGSVFGAPPWLAVIVDTYGFDLSAHIVVDDAGEPRAGLAFAELDDLLGHRLISVPFCDYLDPVVADDEEWKQLVDPLLARGLPLQLKVLHAEPPRRDARFVAVGEMAWHATDLDKSEDALFASLHQRARQNIRAARRHGVTVRFGSDLDDVHAYHELHRRTRKAKHQLLAQPVSFFENIWKRFAPSDSIVVGFAEDEGDVIAASFYLQWNDTWYYKFSASIFERSVVRPNEILAWESMRLARERGCLSYDWGVSDLDQPGLVAYKRKLATDERRVSVFRHTPPGYANPIAAEIKPIFGELTTLLTRDDVPDDVTQRAGEILYRYFTLTERHRDVEARPRRMLVAALAVALVAAGVGLALSARRERTSPVPDAGYFSTLPPGSALPSDAACAARVHRSPWEPRGDNQQQNHTTPARPIHLEHSAAFNAKWEAKYETRVTGNFTGTTDEIIQWAACKWGIADNLVRAQAVEESHWHMDVEGDKEPRSNGHCAPGDDRDPCPTSFGILQIRWYFHPGPSPVGNTYPMSKTMTAFSVDYALAELRGCYDGLSFVGKKATGDIYGCMGVWYSGEWRNPDARFYIERVRHHLEAKPWLYW